MSRSRAGATLDAPDDTSRDVAVGERVDDVDHLDQEHISKRRLRRRQRRRQWRALLLAVVLVAALSVGGPALRRHLSDESTPAKRATAPAQPAVVKQPPAKTTLVVHVGPDGRADLAMVTGTDRHGTTPTLLLMPTGSQVQTPSLGLQTIADLPRLGDAALTTTTVENLLGIGIGKTIVLNDLSLLAAATPAGSLPVTFAQPIHVQDGAGVFAYPAGQQQLAPTDVARLVGRLETSDELGHLKNLQTVFASWFAALHDAGVRDRTAAAVPGFDRVVDVVRADPKVLTLPVQAAATGGGSELFRVDRAELSDIMTTNFADALLAGGNRPRVQLLNGTGAVGLAQEIAGCIVPAGFRVSLTDNVRGFGVKTSAVIAQEAADLPAARRLAKLLHIGPARRASKASGLVDVAVVVGADFHGCTPASGG
ncbi:MAG: LCP family protein [Acidimicrobiia bacterium]